MLKKGQHHTPTFLEGTSGIYQRCESPPNVPGTAAASTTKLSAPTSFHIPQTSTGNSAQPSQTFQSQYYRHQSNPGSSTQLHSVNSNNVQQSAQSTQMLWGQAPRTSASSTSLPMVASNFVGNAAQQQSYIPQYTQNQQPALSPQRRLSHTPHGNNRVAARSELSSHSFSSPRQLQVNNTIQEQQHQLIQNHLLASSNPQFVQQPYGNQQMQSQQQRYSVSSIPMASIQHQLSVQSARSGSEIPRRVLTSSLSIGNVVQHDQPTFFTLNAEPPTMANHSKYQRQSAYPENMRATSAGSAQSLIAQQSHLMLRKHDSASPALVDSCEQPLPPNWEVDITPDGYRYFVDHRNKRTTWIHPLMPENLPAGWTKIFDQLHGVVYYNEIERRSQFEHPGLNFRSSTSASSSINAKKSHHQSHALLQQPKTPNTLSGNLADRIRQSASIQSIIQHQKREQYGGAATQQIQLPHQLRASQQLHQPLPLYQPQHQYYLTDIGSVNVNIENVPDWLKLYGEAPPQSDHLLNWGLFKLNQLQQFDVMLRKLYKQEVLNTVSKYEKARAEINGELLRRFQRS
ncbi:hypothetical protein M3Y97_00312200 [Aphelenchoides bicaudatus]|nr:hypothetical protein M3Y97_00312200 [Aphelenchoides bicaudatus]